MTKKKKILAVTTMVILLLLLTGGMYVFSLYHSTQGGDLDLKNLHIREGLSKDVVNIAVFGIDGRDDPEVDGDRTDVIMIATIDLKENKVKLTSIMRDTFVQITDDSGDVTYQKINAAYSLGKEQLTVKTINENFDLNISEYATVDFNAIMDVVDAVGGITVNIQNEDVLYWTNQYLGESNTFGHRNDPPLTSTGEQTLTGAQALAYSRNRYSDSDYGRTARQREVVNGIFDKIKGMDMLTAMNLVTKLAPHIQTSLDMNEITTYAKAVLADKDLTFDDFRVPTDEYSLGGTLDGVWYLFPNTLVDNARVLHQFIYGADTTFDPSSDLTKISNKIKQYATAAGGEQIDSSMSSAGSESDSNYDSEYSGSSHSSSSYSYSSYSSYDDSGSSSSSSHETYFDTYDPSLTVNDSSSSSSSDSSSGSSSDTSSSDSGYSDTSSSGSNSSDTTHNGNASEYDQ